MNFPILSTIIFLPFLGATFIFLFSKKSENSSAIYISLFTSLANLFLTFFLWYSFDKSSIGFQFVEEKNWISGIIKFKLGIDGISILFIILTAFIAPICIISCVNSIKKRLNEFLIAILILETFILGVFCSLDLIIFYLFFEACLFHLFLIICIWGGPRKIYSAYKFLFTLLGSVLMLAAIILLLVDGDNRLYRNLQIKNPRRVSIFIVVSFFQLFCS